MAPIDDSMPARISPDCPDDTRNILYHAWAHDVPELKKILYNPGSANAQDPKTGETPLHAVIRACGPAEHHKGEAEEGAEEDGTVEEARDALQELFFAGTIWNDVDNNNETPGCVAWRLGQKGLYQLCVDAGVRAELLFSIMNGYEELSSGSNSEHDDEEGEAGRDRPMEDAPTAEPAASGEVQNRAFVPPEAHEKPVTSQNYLNSKLTFVEGKLLDDDDNGVMMAWETDIMERSVAALIPDRASGKRILNIGFGMGIIDGTFAKLQPSRHHIIEAHPAVLENIVQGSSFDPEWEKSAPEEGAYKVHAGRWQDVVPKLVEAGEVYDAIYFDTFAEDYSELRNFFTEYVLALLDEGGRFSFFNGLGADRRVCYDVYTKVVELHGEEAGLNVEWEEIDVDLSNLDKTGEGEWNGVRRRYWTLDSKFLFVATRCGPIANEMLRRVQAAYLHLGGIENSKSDSGRTIQPRYVCRLHS